MHTTSERLATSRALAIRFNRQAAGIGKVSEEKINNLFSQGSEEDRTVFAVELIGTFTRAHHLQYAEAAAELFGEITPEMGRKSSMITIANNQLRVWVGLPDNYGATHVEGDGRNILLEAEGNQRELIRLARRLMPLGSPTQLANNCIIFIYFFS